MTSEKIEIPEGFFAKLVRGQMAIQCATCKRYFKTERLRVVANIEWLGKHARECAATKHALEVARFALHQGPDD